MSPNCRRGTTRTSEQAPTPLVPALRGLTLQEITMRTNRSAAATTAPQGAEPGRARRTRRGSTSPAYFLGRPEAMWTSALHRLR
jgi:hypothetical protein